MSNHKTVWIVMEPKRGEFNRISSTSHIGEADAIRKAIRRWLPEDYFPKIPGDTYYGGLSVGWYAEDRLGCYYS